MKKKVVIVLVIALILLAIVAFSGQVFYKNLGGYPVGFSNKRLVVRIYYCSDVCPEYGGWYNVYYGIDTLESCEQLGGKPLIDLAWGDFIGCAPK